MRKLLILVIVVLVLTGCSTSKQANKEILNIESTEDTPTPTPEPTIEITDEKRKSIEEKISNFLEDELDVSDYSIEITMEEKYCYHVEIEGKQGDKDYYGMFLASKEYDTVTEKERVIE